VAFFSWVGAMNKDVISSVVLGREAEEKKRSPSRRRNKGGRKEGRRVKGGAEAVLEGEAGELKRAFSACSKKERGRGRSDWI